MKEVTPSLRPRASIRATRRGGSALDDLAQRAVGGRVVAIGQVQRVERQHGCRRDDLYRPAVELRECGPQTLVPADESGKARLKRVDVERTGEPNGRGHVVKP